MAQSANFGPNGGMIPSRHLSQVPRVARPPNSPPHDVQFAAAFEFAPIGMALLDVESKGVRVNHAMCEMLGYTQHELLGMQPAQVGHPDDLAEDDRLRALMLSGAFPSYQRDKRYLHKSGRVVWTHISCSLVHDEHGQPASFLLQMQDVTQRKAAELGLRESEERFRATFEQAALGIAHISMDGSILLVNSSLCRMHGYSREELLSMNAIDLTADMLADQAAGAMDEVRALREGFITSYTAQRHFIRKSGEIYPARVSVTMARHGRSEPYMISIVEDLTQHVRDQERIREQARQLAHANEALEGRIRHRTAQLEESNRQLRAFAYSLAHDLRGPLASTDGFARQLELLLGEQLDERGRHYLNRVRAGVQNMSDLTDALLSLANLSQEPLQQASVDLSAVARAWLGRVGEREPSRKVQVLIAETPRVQGDVRLLTVMLGNLLDNAWKFTAFKEHARIEFGAVASDRGDTAFFVRDNGAGFDDAYSDKLFMPFQRLHPATEFAGTGMGLAIVHKIAQRHGGLVWGESKLGQGATFRFTLGGATGEEALL